MPTPSSPPTSDVLMLSVSGCRGLVGTSLTPETVVRFAGAVGTWLVARHEAAQTGKKKTTRPCVVLARDGRVGGNIFKTAAAAGLAGCGCDVIDIDVAMTPSVGTVVDLLGAQAGVVITASHNPQQWNGLKVLLREPGKKPGVVSACAPAKNLADEIIAAFKTGRIAPSAWDGLGTLQAEPEYGAAIHGTVAMDALGALGAIHAIKKNRFRVALDSVNGAGSILTPAWLKILGCKVESTGTDLGAPFPHTPEPIAENLTGLCRLTKKTKSVVGFAQDPDADRLALVDERGRYIGEEYTLVLAALALGVFGRIKRGSEIAVNLSTSRMIDDVAARFGAKVIRTAVGEANVVEAMKTRKCVFGGEGNGGVILPGVTYIRDSLTGMGLILALLAKTGKTISELIAEAPTYAIVKRKVELPDRAAAVEAGEKIARAYASENLDRQDGVRVDFAAQRAWLHVRASNTEPIMRLIAEAPTAADANRILDDAAHVIAAE